MSDAHFLRLALCRASSPNPMVDAVLVKGGKAIGRGWHAGLQSPVCSLSFPS